MAVQVNPHHGLVAHVLDYIDLGRNVVISDLMGELDVFRPDSYVWSITDNGMAKATEMSEYPTQGRHGQGVINVRLPKEAAEVVAVVVGELETDLIITTVLGSTKQFKLGKADIGSRSIKPKVLWKVGDRNRITGAIRMRSRVDVAGDEEEDDGETAVPQQLSLIGEPEPKKQVTKKGSKQKKS